MAAKTYTIRESTQLVLDDVQIGAGNLVRSDYVDRQGIARQGVTAMVWVLLPGQPPQRHRVYPGQDLQVGPVRLDVLDIGVEDGWGFVRLVVNRERG